MSGGLKFSEVSIDPSIGIYDVGLGCIVLGSIVAQRAADAAIEAIRRLEAEESTLLAVLSSSKSALTPMTESVRSTLALHRESLLPVDHTVLMRKTDEAEAALNAARTHLDLQQASRQYEQIELDIVRAQGRKDAEDARHGKTPAINNLRERYDLLKKVAGRLMDGPGTGPLGPAGAAGVLKSTLAAAGGALQTNNVSMITLHVDRLDQAVQVFEQTVREAAAERDGKSAIMRQAQGEALAIIAGLRSDPIVTRWHTSAVNDLETDLATVSAIGSTNPDAAISKVNAARESAQTIVREASGAQIKADQRDYIASSISSTLEDMGFIVDPVEEEHPGHPATASIVHASTLSGKAIAVSVPVEGQVWYNVEGYTKTVDAKVGGGDAAVCDEAEAVIEQMHNALDNEFHVKMGELLWDGKDPNRNLRAVKSTPDGSMSGRERK